MLSLDSLLGQSHAVGLLRRLLDADRLPHALLFHGPEGVGKASAARALAATLLCEAAGRPPCGACASCAMLSRSGHPDFLEIRRLPKKESGSRAGELRSFIVVAQIRELSRLASLAPRQGRRRLFLIDPADRMNAESQNALLKTLEEPPGRALIILVAGRPHLLLPTVRSRCFSVGFSGLRSVELAALLERQGMSGSEAGARAALAEGRPGVALGLDLAESQRRREEVISMLETLSEGVAGVGELASMASSLAGKTEANLVEGLEMLQGLLRDTARSAAQPAADGLLHADLADRLAGLSRRLDAQRAAALIQSIERLRACLRFNTNRQLIAESLLAAVAGGPIP